MNLPRRLLFVAFVTAASSARAVYAPLPEQELNKDLTVSLRAGVSHDSKIYGAQNGAIASTVYEASPRLAYNGSLTDQTFGAFAYTLTIDHFVDRPGDKTLDSHDLMARFAHAFTPTTNIDIVEQYQIAKNPESLLAGLPVNTNQSFKRNELDGRFVTSPKPKFGTTLKFRSINFDYDNPSLGANLDRTENLYGVAATYDVVPEMKAAIEYRREDIRYRTGGATKDKNTDFVMGGIDYAVAKKFSFSGRLGNQWRSRSAAASTEGPYAELSGKYDYAERSFIAGGYVYTLEESSNVADYTDTKVNRLFVNVQQAVTALIVASASFTYEPSQLQGRPGVHANADETTRRAGLALTYLPTAHWSVSASFDYDKVSSEDPNRGQKRTRYGVSAGLTF
jgi:hypothetical protein